MAKINAKPAASAAAKSTGQVDVIKRLSQLIDGNIYALRLKEVLSELNIVAKEEVTVRGAESPFVTPAARAAFYRAKDIVTILLEQSDES